METIKGIIQKVDASSGIDRNNKPYRRWVFTINDKKFSTFDEKIGTGFNVGEFVEMLGSMNGQYWNMETMRNVPMEENKEPAKAEQPNNDLVVDLLRQILAELKGIKGDNGNN